MKRAGGATDAKHARREIIWLAPEKALQTSARVCHLHKGEKRMSEDVRPRGRHGGGDWSTFLRCAEEPTREVRHVAQVRWG